MLTWFKNLKHNSDYGTKRLIKEIKILCVVLVVGIVLSLLSAYANKVLSSKLEIAVEENDEQHNMLVSIASDEAILESLKNELVIYQDIAIDKNILLSNLVQISNDSNVDVVKIIEGITDLADTSSAISTKEFTITLHGSLDNLYSSLLKIEAISTAHRLKKLEMTSDSIYTLLGTTRKDTSLLALLSDQKFLYTHGYTEIPESTEFNLTLVLEYFSISEMRGAE